MRESNVLQVLEDLQRDYDYIMQRRQQREANSYETYEAQWNYRLDEDIVAETPCGNEEKVFEFVVGY